MADSLALIQVQSAHPQVLLAMLFIAIVGAIALTLAVRTTRK